MDEASGTYCGLATFGAGGMGTLTDAVLVVHPELAKHPTPAPADPTDPTDSLSPTPGSRGGTTAVVGPGGPAPAPPPPENRRFFAVAKVDPERYGREFTRIAQEVLQHLTGEGVTLEVTVEITATKPDGFNADKVRTVTENARTLKFDQYGFEND